MVELFANSGDLDQTPHSVLSDLGLHCLSVTHLGVSSLQWVNHAFQYLSLKNVNQIIFPMFSFMKHWMNLKILEDNY